MAIQTPYSATLPIATPLSVLQHQVSSYARDLAVLPIKFTMSAGALTTAQVTRICRLTDLGGNAVRLFIPATRPENVHLSLAGGLATSITVDYSTAASGYITITFGGAVTSVYQGILFVRRRNSGAGGMGVVTNGSIPANVARSVPSKGIFPVKSLVQGMSFFWLSFQLDAGSNVLPATAEGLPLFRVTHPGAGQWSIQMNHLLNSAWVFYVDSTVGHMSAALSPLNEIDLTSAGDPGACTVNVLAMGPTSKVGIDSCLKVNTLTPRMPPSLLYPLFSPMRGTVLGAHRLVTDAGGLIVQAGSYIPPIGVAKNVGDLRLDIGKSLVALSKTTMRTAANVSYAESKASLELTGRTIFTLGGAVASSVLHGVHVSSTGSYRG